MASGKKKGTVNFWLVFLTHVNGKSRNTSFRQGLIKALNDVLRFFSLSSSTFLLSPTSSSSFLPCWLASHCGLGRSRSTLSLLLIILEKTSVSFPIVPTIILGCSQWPKACDSQRINHWSQGDWITLFVFFLSLLYSFIIAFMLVFSNQIRYSLKWKWYFISVKMAHYKAGGLNFF